MAIAGCAKRGRRAFLGRGAWLFCGLAPDTGDVLAVIAIGQIVTGEVIPYVTGGGGIHVGFAEFQRKFIGHRALVVINALVAAIANLPGFLVIVAGNAR